MLYDPIWDKRHEECGVLGIYDKDLDIPRYVYWGLFALQHRGQESGGMALSDGEEIKTFRGMGLVSTVFQDGVPDVKSTIGIGHGAILAMRDNPDHVQAMKDHDITPIDLVVVNLYPFQQTIAKEGVTLAEAIENIDIGGPCMVRASAKNNKFVAIVTNPAKYGEIVEILKKDGEFTSAYRLELAREAFHHTATYDTAIAAYLDKEVKEGAAR